MSDETSGDFSAMVNELNEKLGGWDATMGLKILSATRDEVVGELEVRPVHVQPYGIVHGGVYASMLESLASVGAAIDAGARGQSAVGLDNHTSFIRAVRGGRLRLTATPLTRGGRSQLWEGRIVDEKGRLVATGRVRLLCLDSDTTLAGETVALKE
jgi:uncharacterized protein (TIGR00369 family)